MIFLGMISQCFMEMACLLCFALLGLGAGGERGGLTQGRCPSPTPSRNQPEMLDLADALSCKVHEHSHCMSGPCMCWLTRHNTNKAQVGKSHAIPHCLAALCQYTRSTSRPAIILFLACCNHCIVTVLLVIVAMLQLFLILSLQLSSR